jgi:hypothetical protein
VFFNTQQWHVPSANRYALDCKNSIFYGFGPLGLFLLPGFEDFPRFLDRGAGDFADGLLSC